MANRFYNAGFESIGADDPTLRPGATGDAVSKLQLRLNAAGANVGDSGADGTYGPGTEQAVRNFQAAYGLNVDGVVGPETWAKLYEVTGSPAAPGAKPKPVLKIDPLQVVGHVPKADAKGGGLDWEPFAIGGAIAAAALGTWLATRPRHPVKRLAAVRR
jgi:hypothetical protein